MGEGVGGSGFVADGVKIELDVIWMSGWSYYPDTRTLVKMQQHRCENGHIEAVREVISDVDSEDL